MTLKRIILIFLLPALIAACSVTYEYAKERHQYSKACCRDISEFEYTKLTTEAPYIVEISERSSSFDFATGKSYFISLELPSYKQVYGVSIKSFALGDHIDKSHIFFPKVILLDDDYSAVREVSQYFFKIAKASLSETAKENKWGLPVKLEGVVIINNPEIKYMIILTTESLLSGSTSYTVQRSIPIILPGISGAVPTYKDVIKIPHSPFGKLTIRLDNDKKN